MLVVVLFLNLLASAAWIVSRRTSSRDGRASRLRSGRATTRWSTTLRVIAAGQLATGCATVLVSGSAWAQEAAPSAELTEERLDACFDAYEQSQILLRDDRMTEAEQRAQQCSENCPPEIVTECQALSSQAKRDVPTAIVLAVTERGTEAEGVQLEVDGSARDEATEGELALDPGPHEIRFFRASDGWEERVALVMRRGEKRRQVRVVVPDERVAAEKPTERPPAVRQRSAVLPWIITSYAVGAVGLGVSATGGIVALSDRSTLDECGTSCDEDLPPRLERRSDTWLLAADIGLGVGVVGVVTGTALWIWGPKERKTNSSTSWNVVPTPGGAAALVSGRF